MGSTWHSWPLLLHETRLPDWSIPSLQLLFGPKAQSLPEAGSASFFIS